MNCSNCGKELTVDMLNSGMCFSCGFPTSESEKITADEHNKAEIEYQKELKRKEQEAQNQYDKKIKDHMLNTSFSFDGYTILQYCGLVSGESVIGSDLISNLEASITNTFGLETYGYSEKIKAAKRIALEDMIKQSVSSGGNAIIGISYSFTNFMNNMIGISVNGTSVKIEKNNISR